MENGTRYEKTEQTEIRQEKTDLHKKGKDETEGEKCKGSVKNGLCIERILAELIIVLGSGIAVTWIVYLLRGSRPTADSWPLLLGVCAFAFTSIGYFTSERGEAILYGILRAISFICCVLQILMLF